jgi:2-phospho-L-lactate/phosphoenolpyruvate guanylyltransferase
MNCWAIIPVKSLAAAKSRLAPILSLRQRRRLMLSMLEHTLGVLTRIRRIKGTIVVSKDAAVRSAARRAGAVFVQEKLHDGMNRALTRAAKEAVRRGAGAVMILPVDLPLLDAGELGRVIRASKKPPAVTIVPDRTDRGTNLLLAAPPGAIRFSFGKNSRRRHAAAARKAGAALVVLHRPALAEDIDRPDDLLAVQDLGWEGLDL